MLANPAPAAPTADLLSLIHPHIRDVITQETPETTKALLSVVLDWNTVESRSAIKPTFRVHCPTRTAQLTSPKKGFVSCAGRWW